MTYVLRYFLKKINFRDGWTNLKNNDNQETTEHIPVNILQESKTDICKCLMAGGGHLKLRNLSKISYIWYYMGRYLNVLFSFISCYGVAHVLEGVDE